jgi:hypothetical protein
MAHWAFEVMFSYDTQFIFGSLMFTAGEDGSLELLIRVQRQAITYRSMEKLCIIQLIHHHQHQTMSAQV